MFVVSLIANALQTAGWISLAKMQTSCWLNLTHVNEWMKFGAATAKPLWKLRQQSCFLGLNLNMFFDGLTFEHLFGRSHSTKWHPTSKTKKSDYRLNKTKLVCEFRSLCFSTIPFKMKREGITVLPNKKSNNPLGIFRCKPSDGPTWRSRWCHQYRLGLLMFVAL